MTSVAYVASVAPEAQLAFDLDTPPIPARPALSSHVSSGPGRLLRKLVVGGLDPQAVEAAAALVVALDEEATS